jgi:hypothetical protein
MQALIVSKNFGRRSINAPDLYAYVGDNSISAIDPLGFAAHLVDVSNAGDQVALYDWAKSFEPPNFNTIVVHGGPNGQFSYFPVGSSTISPQNLADLLKGTDGYDPTLPTLLVACTSGATKRGAQALANALGTVVVAPQQVVYANSIMGLWPVAYARPPRPYTNSPTPPTVPITWVGFAPAH